jgi:Zinc finger, C3HC4 type (RING finger)
MEFIINSIKKCINAILTNCITFDYTLKNEKKNILQNQIGISHKTPHKTPSFPLNPPADYESLNENETCKICLINKLRTINLKCGHSVFCFECSKRFILNNIQHKCPLCREDIIKIKML